ncbi:MAG: efflux RND transporter periplasmic adaptor subunit [Micavibrio sp.]|nr:efflux RND transporter periplasmic adaptor subunit [Micavibrio sp.]
MASKKSTSRIPKPVKVLLVLAIMGGLAFGGLTFYQQRSAAAEAAKRVSIVTIEKGSIEELVTAQGKLEPKEYVDVGVQVSGQIKKLYVALGDVVKKGDPLGDIDPQVYESRVKADEAALKTLHAQIAQQQAQVKLAEQQYTRNKTLKVTNAVSQDAYESAETALEVAKAQVDSLQAQLEQAESTLDGDKASLGYTKVFAPMDGTVVVADIKEGQTLNAVQSAPTLVQLANLDTMTVRAQVAEADIMKLKPGGEVYFTTLGNTTRRWTGVVRQLLPTPEIVNEVVLYDVLVDVENKDRQLMSGMSTQMFFVLGKATDVPLVPVAALGKHVAQEDKDGAAAYRVHVPSAGHGGKSSEKTVFVGLMDRTMAEVKEGLQEGDEVAIEITPSTADPAAGLPKRMKGMTPRL